MDMDAWGNIHWEKKDFRKHGLIATYLLGECRCKKCKARILENDNERVMPARYNSQ